MAGQNMNKKRLASRNGPGMLRLLSGVSILVLCSFPARALDPAALPEGGRVHDGEASLDYSTPGELHVRQDSTRAVIDWDSFNIGKDALTEFHQPSARALTVNRVTGGNIDPTLILGSLESNGQIIVLDRNGIIFGHGAQINVGGIIAAAGDIDTDKVMAGGDTLEITNVNPAAAIVNEGSITVAEAGLAAFVAPTVVNSGVIEAKLGHVELASGTAATLDLYGDGLIEVAASPAMQKSLVENAGLIEAEGGSVAMTAAAAKDIVDSTVNMSGIIDVSSATQAGGKIILSGAATNISGALDASGKTGGGEILAGGDAHGAGETANAQYTTVTQDAVLKANATGAGDGGRIIVWADKETVMNGRIEARGGAEGGDGGFVETSGKENLRVGGSVDTRAPGGKDGLLLLDPANITIANGTGDGAADGTGTFSGNPSGAAGTVAGGDTAPVTIYESELEGIAATTNISLAATGNITISNLTGDGNLNLAQTAGHSVTFNAGNRFAMTAANTITTAGGDLNIITGGGTSTVGNLTTGAGTVTFTVNGGTVNASGIISNSGGVVKEGAGGLTLSGANTFTGGLTVKAGNVAGGTSASAFGGSGTGTIILGDSAGGSNDASIQGLDNLTYDNPIVLASNTTGILAIRNSNPNKSIFTGGVTGDNNLTFINGSTSGGQSINMTTNPININGYIDNASTQTTNRVFITAPVGSNVTGIIQSGFGQLSVSGLLTVNPGGTTLTSSMTTPNSANGIGLLIQGGIDGTGDLIIHNNGPLASGVTIQTSSIDNVGTITNSGTGTGNTAISAPIGANVTGVIQDSATSDLKLTSTTSLYTSPTTINSGILTVNNDRNFGAVPGAATPGLIVFNGGTLATATSFTLNANRGISLDADAVIDVASGKTLTYGGIIAGTGALDKTSPGSLTLTGDNSFSGGLFILAGTVTGATNSFGGSGTGTVTLGDDAGGSNNATMLASTNGGVYNNPIVLASNTTGILTIGTCNCSANVNFTGGVTGDNDFQIDSFSVNRSLTFSTNAINNAGTITNVHGAQSNAPNVIISAPIGSNVTGIINNTAQTKQHMLISGAITLGAGGLEITTANDNSALTISGGITGTGNLTLNNNGALADGLVLSTGSVNNTGTVTNSGTGAGNTLVSAVIGTNVTGVTQDSATSGLTLSGANTYTGTTAVTTGTLKLGAANTIGSASAVTVATNGVFNLNGFSDTMASLVSDGTVTFGTGNTLTTAGVQTYNGDVTGDTISMVTQTGNLTINHALDLDGLFTATSGGTTVIAADITSEGMTFNSPVTMTGARTLDAGTGMFTNNSTISMVNTLLLYADDFDIGGDIKSSTGNNKNTVINVNTAGRSLGLGTGAAGDTVLDDTQLSHIKGNGGSAASINFTTNNGDIYVKSLPDYAQSTSKRLAIQAGTGTIDIAASGVDAGAFPLSLTADGFSINGPLDGTSGLTLKNSTRFTTMGFGDGAAGTNLFTTAELNNISPNWSTISFQSNDGAVNLAAYNWLYSASITSTLGAMTVSGAQDAGTHDLSFYVRGNLIFNAPVGGSGNLTIAAGGSSNQSLAIGDNATPSGMTARINDASLNNITPGWNSIIFTASDGATEQINFDTAGTSYTFYDPVIFKNTRPVTIYDNLIAGAGSDASFTFDGASHTGTTFTINGNIDLSAGDGTGGIVFQNLETLNLSGNLTTGGGDISLLGTVANNVVTGGAFDAGAGGINIGTKGLAAGANDLSFTSDAIDIAGPVATTGNLTAKPSTNSTSIGLGGGAGAFNLTDGELAFLTVGGKLVIGSAAGSGLVTIDSVNIVAGGYAFEGYGGDIVVDGLSAADTVLLVANGGMTLNNALTTTAGGNSIVLVADSFTNNVGGGGINPGAGRFLVYSSDPDNDDRGGLAFDFKRYNKTYAGYAPGSVTESGDGFLYSIAPVLTVTADSFMRDEGMSNPAFTGVVTGFIDGDTLASLDAAPSYSTSATPASAAGTYAITPLGASDVNYTFHYVDGALTVNAVAPPPPPPPPPPAGPAPGNLPADVSVTFPDIQNIIDYTGGGNNTPGAFISAGINSEEVAGPPYYAPVAGPRYKGIIRDRLIEATPEAVKSFNLCAGYNGGGCNF